MNAGIGKNIFQALGILSALMGIVNLCAAPTFLADKDGMIIIGFLVLFLGLYLFYVSFLIWWRFSPLAIRHICGVIAFFSLGIIQIFVEWVTGSQLSVASGIISLFSLIAVFCLYRWASKYFTRMIFGNEVK